MSKFEKEFEVFFIEKKLKFLKNDRKQNGTPDFSFVMEGYNVVLFLHGCYWHGHNCKEWKLNNIGLSRQAVVARKDLQVRRYYMRQARTLYLRCWECSFNKNKEYQLDKIYDAIIGR